MLRVLQARWPVRHRGGADPHRRLVRPRARPGHLEGDHGGDLTCRRCASTWAREKEELDESSRAAALEAVVDLHTFDPDELARTALRAGAVDVGTTTEELTAAFLGWPVRTFEAAVRPGALGWGWALVRLRLLEAAVRGSTARWPGSCRSASSTTSASPA